MPPEWSSLSSDEAPVNVLTSPPHSIPPGKEASPDMPLTSETSVTTNPSEDKLPHDASVFVGSLPSNIDQVDLTRMLMKHLSEHTQIKNIKVVRDSKGGVCAFVQCENASSATALIHILHSSPSKPFLGRLLRFEPARAFRTLHISYRAPIQFVRPRANSSNAVVSNVELELPVAMRIWKNRNSRFHSILYNTEAIQAERNCDRNVSDFSDHIIFLHPLKFDGETLRDIASHFGPLEKFSQLDFDSNEEDDMDSHGQSSDKLFPELHRAHRSPSMENSCWELKWEHRDDCVSALMTLRRVPHLTVTWAHQPLSTPTIRPHYLQSFPSSDAISARSFQQNKDSNFLQSHTFPSTFASSESKPSLYEPAYDSWTEEKVNNSDIRHGPFATPAGIYSVPWEDREGLTPADPQIGHKTQPVPRANEHEINGGCTSKEISSDLNVSDESEGHELYIPATPTLDTSTTTPMTCSQFPVPPTSSRLESSSSIPNGYDAKYFSNTHKGSRHHKEIDPTTLFVGGLEMFGPGAWDEEKVKKFFSRFGGLESVKVVRPLNSSAAFAFVKFDNAESPARAVFEEHNRVYEGRAMRVQLRDINPPRGGSWKFGRNRGRFHQNQLGISRRFTLNSSYDGEEINKIHLNDHSKYFGDPRSTNAQLSSLPTVPSADGTFSDTNRSPNRSSSSGESSQGNSSLVEKYREWYDDPQSPGHTPEPSSVDTSVSPTAFPFQQNAFPYPMGNAPYFPPPPWMHPYIPHAPYQMPYYTGYPVYPPIPSTPSSQQLTSPPSSDAHASPNGAQQNWRMGMYPSYIPYPSLPARIQGPEGQHHGSQPPVVPTGFIQNEQGTLIAVYHPEALDQYLAVSGANPTLMGNNLQKPQLPPPHFCDVGMSPNSSGGPASQARPKTNTSLSSLSRQFSNLRHSSPSQGSFHIAAPHLHRPGVKRESFDQHSPHRSFNYRSTRGHIMQQHGVNTDRAVHPLPPAILARGYTR